MAQLLDHHQFSRRFLLLIALAWTVPPIFGLSFLLAIRMFSLQQLGVLLTTPVEPLFVGAWLGFAVWYFRRYAEPIRRALESGGAENGGYEPALERMRRFSLHFWSLFLVYLAIAPSSVILGLTLYTGFTASAEGWFRFHLVALIVSIIVGLPIFFRILDLFGEAVAGAPLRRPHVTIKAKVFLIGALMPLLVDTMIVQYYWTKTGYFSYDTFAMWAILELLAIGGSLMFVGSINQSLQPLQSVVSAPRTRVGIDGSHLAPQSTDELGVLANRYRTLLEEINIRNDILHVSNRAFREKGTATRIDDVVPQILGLCRQAVDSDMVVLLLVDEESRELVDVAQTDRPYRAEGYKRIPLDRPSVASRVFQSGAPLAVDDIGGQPPVDREMCAGLSVRSVMGAPLDAEGRAIGVLLSVSAELRSYSEDDIALLDALAREVALAVNSQDLHARRAEAIAELEKANENIRLLLESSGDGIFGVDEKLNCTFVNSAAASILGYGPEEIRGKRVHEFLDHSDEHQHHLKPDQCHVARTVREGSSFRINNNYLRAKSGELIPVQYSSNPIKVEGQTVGAVVVFRDIAKDRALARKMDYLASHDTLTGLFNRHRFEQHLSTALETAQDEGASHALCYLDLDQFKVVNDTCGHTAGDELLRQITAELLKRIRQGDILARLGGDEFGLLLQQCPLDQAVFVAHELRKLVEDFRFVWKDKTFALGVSIGIASIDSHTQSVNSALSNADTACYVAKDAGRNRVHLHQQDDLEISRRHGEMQWVSRIQDALDRDLFHLVYQVIAGCSYGESRGQHVEILIRLRDGEGNDVQPGAFLPATERYNLSSALDRWVVRNVFQWINDLGDRLDELELCCVNLSGNSIGEEEFLRYVIDRMEASGVPGEKICFEVTETAAIAKLTHAVHFINELKKHDCCFALDDFGSGMSSFGYLKVLPVDYLKIDGSFVRDMANDHIDRTMVKSINEVGHALGIRTIAEYVEDDAIFRLLKDIGVDYAQGYGIQTPRPLEEF